MFSVLFMRTFLSERQVHSSLVLISRDRPLTLPRGTVRTQLLAQCALQCRWRSAARRGRSTLGRHNHGQVEHTLSAHGRVPRVPQAWAAGSVFHLLQAILGLHADAHKRTLYLNHPVLPPWLPEITLHNLRVGTTRVTIRFWRERDQSRHDVLSSRAEIQMKAGIATRYQPSTSSGPSQDCRGTQRGGRDHRCMSMTRWVSCKQQFRSRS